MTTEIDWQNTYNAAMDSVNLLNRGKPEGDTDAEWSDCVRRNVEHLKLVVAKEGWPESFDLSPLTTAITDND